MVSRACLILILIIAGWVAGIGLAQSIGEPAVYVITEPVVDDQQSLVRLDVVVRDSHDLPVPDLSAANFSIGEPADNLVVTAEPDLPLALAVIVDTSFGSNDELIRGTLRAFFDTYYRTDDAVTFYIIEGERSDAVRVVNIGDPTQIQEVIDSIRTSNRYYSILPALNLALGDMQAEGSSPTHPRQVLFVGSLLNSPDEAAASSPFAQNGIPFHVVQAHRNRQSLTPAFRALAENGGGLFVNNDGGVFVLQDGVFSAVNLLKVMYDVIANSRLVYHIQYRSLNRSLDVQRAVTLTVILSDETRVQTDFDYEWVFKPPVVAFADSNQLNPLRRPSRDPEDQSINFDISEQPITVVVRFLDGVPRPLRSLRLEVIEKATGNVLQSRLELDPQPDTNGNYVLIWSLDDYSRPDTTTAVEVRVYAVDVLDYAAEIIQDGRVRVNPAPPLPTATPVPVPTATLTPVPTVAPPTPQSQARQVPVITIEAENDNTLIVLISALVILVLIVLILFVRLRRYRRQQLQGIQRRIIEQEQDEFATNAGNGSTPGNDSGAESTKGEGAEKTEDLTLLAKMLVKEGVEELGMREVLINKEYFTIGRSADLGCDLVINVPYVSPQHCQIIVQDGQFSVRDLNTKNGTFINGERIPRDREITVPLGSEIGITKNIILEIWGPDMEFEFEEELVIDPKTGIPTSPHGRELVFKPLPGLRYAPDEDAPITDDYSPI